MKTIIIGNLISLIAVFFAILNGTRKTKKEMILCDIGSATFYTIADLILKGYSGVVQNLVGIFRNLAALYLPDKKYIGWLLVVAAVVFGIYFNNRGWIGLLPVATSCWYSICIIDKNAGHLKLKVGLILNSMAFLIYSAVLYNLVGVISNLLVVSSTTFTIIKNKK